MSFYRCPKCKENWHYPIEKCPKCFSSLKKITPKRIKVIGISKVTIPTILHPKIPYFVLLLEDERGNRWIKKSFKEVKIGEDLKIEESKDKSTVAISRIKYDIASSLQEIVRLIGGIKISPEIKILILPTLLAPKHPYFAVNTNPKLLDCLLKYLTSIGAEVKNIKVAAQSFDETPIEASAQKSQLLEVCVKNKITPLDLSKTNFIQKNKEEFTFEISEEVFNTDLIINLPIFNLDSKFKVKGALENTLKFLKKESYLSLKYLHDDFQVMGKLQEVLPEYLTITGGENIQKTTGHTSFIGLMIASFNPFNLDRVCAEIAMLKDLPDFLKKINIQDIPIVGRKIEEIQYDIERVGT